MNEKMKKKDRVTLAIFVFVTITAGGYGYLVDQILAEQPKGNSLGMGLWLVLPFLTGVILRILNRDLKQIGFRFYIKNHLKWYIFSFVLFPCVMLVSIIVAKILGGFVVNDVELSGLFGMMLGTFLANCVKNIFEEFAWRGCLVPYLEKTGMNDWFLYLVSGFVWGSWHITYYLFFLPDDYFTERSRPMMVVAGIIIMMFWSPVFVELRRLTNSVWPCVILHSMEDAVPTLLFVTAGVFQMKESFSVALDPISGMIPVAMVFASGLVLRKYRRRDAGVCT
ncbi:MAG: CPBP family intramembrane metalloprotease [Lachnospiraceae bacterium]|nr:CPBP family intramembrane metalloprotease [Lachnospiraceae bacterium]